MDDAREDLMNMDVKMENKSSGQKRMGMSKWRSRANLMGCCEAAAADGREAGEGRGEG
jgi:hypothetical protein